MKEMLEKLWKEYLFEECATIDTDEERRLTKKAAEQHEKVNASLNKEQQDGVEKYVDSLHDIEALLVKKAFFKGCELAFSFLFPFC